MASCDDVRTAVQNGMPQVLHCSPARNGGLRLRTVFEHPDGDLVDVYFLPDQSGRYWLTDLGEAVRHLDNNGFDAVNTAKKRALFQDALSNLNVQESSGRLLVSVEPTDQADFVRKFLRLCQAITRVGDLVFTAREQSPRFFRDDVQEYLRSGNIAFEEKPLLVGRSGQQYTLDFRVPRRQNSLLLKTLTTGSRAAAETVISSTVRMFFDLSRTSSLETRVSIVDDSDDVWTPQQFDLLGNLGEVVLWSQPERLIELATH